MSAPAPPSIPPRPIRSHQAVAAGVTNLPDIPPRPAHKRLERSVSPSNFPRSPLNESPFGTSLMKSVTADNSSLSLPPRPPSVTLPSIGQEGSEYADLQYGDAASPPLAEPETETQTRSIGGDLQLHAPRPSLPKSTAKAQVAAVTRTDSKQAAALGIGKPSTPVHDEHEHHQFSPLPSKSSFSQPGSQASGSRRASVVYGDEHGPAELGIRVPINPLLGDVQAPSPAPLVGERNISIGSNGELNHKKRHHGRTKSGREIFLPPGSYGLHGHGVQSQDKFEKDWYAKHPEQLLHDEDQGHYASTGSGRGEFALSSEDLNQIVRRTATRSAGPGTLGSVVAYPDEQIGYLASDQYSTRSQVASPNYLSKLHSNLSQPAIESPLRKTSFPTEEHSPEEFRKSKGSFSAQSDDVIDEHEGEIIHVENPTQHYHKITGGEETVNETNDLQPYATHATDDGGLADEHGYSAPILASDELAKEEGLDDMQPAITPQPDRRSALFDEYRGSGDITPSSRPTSRPASIHGAHGIIPSLARFTSRHEEHREDMHTPLEDVAEYEPLFPDEDTKKKAVGDIDRFKQRPDTLKHRFPSQDIWEDTPSSAMYVATVSTPDLPAQVQESAEKPKSSYFGPEDAETASKGVGNEEKKQLPVDEELSKSKFAPHLRDDVAGRPGLPHRFPSQDIWEDSPDSHYLVTTVSSLPDEEVKSPTEASSSKPVIPPRPSKSKLGEAASTAQAPPSVPARPQKRVYAVPPPDAKLTNVSIPLPQQTEKEPSPTEIRKVPSLPDRPKPQIPPRPAKKTSSEGLEKTISGASAGSSGSAEAERDHPVPSPPQLKAKPQIPAKPGQGSKIATLKSNFMNDLSQKLQLGPPKEKEIEPEVEKEAKPLEDSRKGRARGPRRRAPAKSPTGPIETAAVSAGKPLKFSMASPLTLWHINNADGLLNVHSHGPISSSEPETKPAIASSAKEADIHDEPPAMSESKIEQMDNSTLTHVTSGKATEKEEPAVSDSAVPDSMAPQGLAMNMAGESTDPSSTIEHISQIDKANKIDNIAATLSTQTTASSGAISGHTLDRVKAGECGPTLSQHSTADSEASGATLARQETPEVASPSKFRTEQVAAAPNVAKEEEETGVSGIEAEEKDETN